MSISKFIPSKIGQWKNEFHGDIEIWVAGYNTTLIIKKIIPHINNKKNIDKYKIKNILNTLDCHFGLVVMAKHWSMAATDCIRSYPIFWKKVDSIFILSPQANNINNISNSEVDKKQQLAFQMSGYTIGSSTLWKNINNMNTGEFIIFQENEKYNVFKYFKYQPWLVNNNKYDYLKDKLKLEIKTLIVKLIKKANGKTIIIPLSAGLDSRLIASGLKEYKYTNVKCFSYGLKNNFESKASKIIAQKLGFEWKFVEINVKKAKQYYTSSEYKKFSYLSNDGCSTPGIQDVFAIKILIEKKYIKQSDIIINGNSGDFISGGHIPLEAENWEFKDDINTLKQDILSKHIEKHYALWDKLVIKNNKKTVFNELISELLKLPIKYDKNNKPHGLLEVLEFENRQCKYVVNFQRVYDYYNLSWLLPLWDKSFINFWQSVPVQYKIDQKLYKEALKEMNMGSVWTKPYQYKFGINSKLIKIIRFIFKMFFIFKNKKKWHQFDKKYFSYWTDNICGQSILPYTKIIKNNCGARHFVSWHTLLSEYENLKSNWQNIKL